MTMIETQREAAVRRVAAFVPFAIEEADETSFWLMHVAKGKERVFLRNQPGVRRSDGYNVFIDGNPEWEAYKKGCAQRGISLCRVASLLGLLPRAGYLIYFTPRLNETVAIAGLSADSRIITAYDFFAKNGMEF